MAARTAKKATKVATSGKSAKTVRARKAATKPAVKKAATKKAATKRTAPRKAASKKATTKKTAMKKTDTPPAEHQSPAAPWSPPVPPAIDPIGAAGMGALVDQRAMARAHTGRSWANRKPR